MMEQGICTWVWWIPCVCLMTSRLGMEPSAWLRLVCHVMWPLVYFGVD